MLFKANIARRFRSYLRRRVECGDLPLVLVGPRHFDGYCGRTGWFYATRYDGQFFIVSKRPVATRDGARADAERRFGRKANDYRPNRRTRRRMAA